MPVTANPRFIAGTSDKTSSAGLSVAPAYPSTTAGDVVVVFLWIDGTTSPVTDPTGFTAINNSVSDSTGLRSRAWYRVLDGSESGSITVAWTTNNRWGIAAAVAYRGFDATGGLINGHFEFVTTASGTSRQLVPTFSPARRSFILGAVGDVQAIGAQSWTASNAGMLERLDDCTTSTSFVSATVEEQVYDQAPTTSSSLLNPILTSARSSSAAIGWSIAFNLPYGAGTTDVASGSTFANPGKARQVNTSVTLAPIVWPSFGQGWPRIKQG